MTLHVWRIAKSAGRKAAFSGEGARLYGGRWNSPGTPLIYTAGSRALAALEVLVHLDAPELLGSFRLFEAAFQELLVESPTQPLPRNWRTYPAPRTTQEIGDRWAANLSSAVLKVPSVLVPAEFNYLLNPRHPRFKEVILHPPVRFEYDARLGKNR